MSEAHSSGRACGAIPSRGRQSATLRAADGLCLAAAPTFAIMAVLTGVFGSDQPDSICSAVEHTSTLSGMIVMYFLMSGFHSPPWLKLISSQRNGARARPSYARARYVVTVHVNSCADRRYAVGEAKSGWQTNSNRRDTWT